MKCIAAIYFLLLSTYAEAFSGDRTITKVVKLLQDMLTKSKEDGEKDRDLYAKFKCYCDDNEADKKEAISSYEKEVKMLRTDIAGLQASSGELSTECAQLKQDISDNEEARNAATSIRDKAKEDFAAEETDMSAAIDQMGQAIDALAAVGGDQKAVSFMGQKSLLKLTAVVKQALTATSTAMTKKQRQTMEAFVQAPFTGTYTSQSGEIVGILKSMKETFTNNLKSAQSAEKAAAEAHEKFMKIKMEQHETLSKSYEAKQGKLGGNDEELATNRESLEAAQNSLADDQDFLAKLLDMCPARAKEFGERKLLRANEEAAISQAIAILNSDLAFETFGKVKSTKSGATSLFQISRHTDSTSIRRSVQARLKTAAKAQKSLKIARVMALLEAGNPFATVLSEIEKMVKLIDQEQKADDEQKAWCDSEREDSTKTKEDKETKVTDLTNDITTLEDAIDNPETGLKSSIKGAESDLQLNHENQVTETKARSEENMAYQKNVKNIASASSMLSKAIKVLQRYYGQLEDKKEELVQKAAKEEPAPPETWESEGSEGKGFVGQKKKGGDVIEMLEFILGESNKEEEEAHKAEEDSQHAFEDSMQELKTDQSDTQETLAGLHLSLAEKEKSLAEARDNLVVTEKSLKAVERYLEKIKPGCDFITENIETRSGNRDKEKAALEEALTKLKDTPAFKAASNAAEQEALGDCKDTCNKDGQDHAKCKACLAGVSVPGYCAGHKEDTVAGC